ncbi:MAG: aminoglycoside phosphotransferase family protein, partial [Thermodesulfobium sp.]
MKVDNLGLNTPIKVENIQAIESGETHYNYLLTINGRKFLLRLTSVRKDDKGGNSWGAARINMEFNSIKNLERLGIAPKVYYKDTSCKILSKPFIISDYVPGRPIKKMRTGDLKSLSLMLAGLHSIHNVKGLRKEPVKAYNKEYIKKRVAIITSANFKYVNRSFKSALIEAYKKIEKIKLKKQRLSVIHGDVSKDNLLRTENGLKLIDWESVRLSEPQFEIATALDRLNLNDE